MAVPLCFLKKKHFCNIYLAFFNIISKKITKLDKPQLIILQQSRLATLEIKKYFAAGVTDRIFVLGGATTKTFRLECVRSITHPLLEVGFQQTVRYSAPAAPHTHASSAVLPLSGPFEGGVVGISCVPL